jgi:cation-transporting P-type ATPase 13A2
MIQFTSVTLLYQIGANLSDAQFLYIDLFMIIPLSIFMGQTEAYKSLTPHLPSGSLLSLPVLTSVLGCVVIQFGVQVFMFFFVRKWSFYHEIVINPEDENDNTLSYENTAIVFVSNFQYLIVCMVFSISKPFR